MADIRPVTITLRDRQTTGGSIPSDAVFGEPFVNLFNGVLRFSGVTGGDYETTPQAGVFEVGSTLYNQYISNRLNINNNFIISGDTGFISTYGGITGAGLNGKFLSGTSAGFVLGNISDIQGTTTRVQPGTNTTTGGTPDLPTVNVVDSPSFNNITYSGTSTGGNSIATNVSASTFYSAGTDLYNIFLTSGDLSGTSVSAGANIAVQQTGNNYEVSTVDSPSFNNITYSGTSTGGNSIATNVSATTFYSAGTDVETIINNIVSASGPHTLVQPGTNITTGGTSALPTVNLVDSPSVNNITYSGTSTGGNSIATNVSATTFYSASTNLETIINNIVSASGPHTLVQPGTNTTTGGTSALPTVNLVDSPSVNGLTVSGTGNFTGTLQSGGTDLYNIFAQPSDVVNSITAGSNISVGGTAINPIINVVSSPAFNGISFSGTGTGNILNAQILTATAITDSNLTSGQAVYASTGGLLKTNSGFTYDDGSSTLFAQNMEVGSASMSGSVTIWGDVTIMGDAISAFTSQLYIEDNTIELNYNPTASTTSTSLGAGWIIQDGDGIASGDVFLDIRGTATGVANRSFTTNLENIRVGETGTVSSPNGNFLLKTTDILDGGSY